jgi:hypothetical protein
MNLHSADERQCTLPSLTAQHTSSAETLNAFNDIARFCAFLGSSILTNWATSFDAKSFLASPPFLSAL